MRRANRYKHPRAHTHTRTHTHTEWEWTSWVILLFLPSAFPFRLLLPSIICLSPPSLPLSQSLSFSLWRSCNWFSSVYSFFKTGFETWEADKSHIGPSPSLHPSPLSSPPASTSCFPLCWPSPHPETLGQGGGSGGMQPTPPPPPLSPRTPLLPLLFLSLFLLHLSLSPPSLSSSPFQLDLWPHSTNGIKVMHHT